MLTITHALAGLIIGKLTGNYPGALIGAVLIDLDHVYAYADAKLSFMSAVKATVDPVDRIGWQRNYLHSLLFIIPTSAFFYLLLPVLGISFLFGALSHLLLDMLDNTGIAPLYPFKYNLRGNIIYSPYIEYIFMVALGAIYYASFFLF